MDYKKNFSQVLFFLGQRNIKFKIIFFGTDTDSKFAQEIVDMLCKESTKRTEKCLQEFLYIRPSGFMHTFDQPLKYYKLREEYDHAMG